jgi:hypothetical protein
VRQFGEALHQCEPLVPNGLKSLQRCRVFPTRRHAQILEGDGIEIVVRECDEPKSAAPQVDHFGEHAIHMALPRPLSIGAPDGADEQCFGHPRTVCTDAHMYRREGNKSHRPGKNRSPSSLPRHTSHGERATTRSPVAPAARPVRRRRSPRRVPGRARTPRRDTG